MITWKDVQMAEMRGEQLRAEAEHYSRMAETRRTGRTLVLAPAAAWLGSRLVQAGQRLQAMSGPAMASYESRPVTAGAASSTC